RIVGEKELRRHAYFVEENLALVQRALAQLVERLATRDAGQIKRQQEHRAAGTTDFRILIGGKNHAAAGNRAAGHPGGFLPVEDVILAITPAAQISASGRV